MILEILKFVHVVFGAVGIGAGAWILFGILEGSCSRGGPSSSSMRHLLASATGLLFHPQHFLPTQWAAMSAVYVSGVAVLAWRRYGLVGIWALIFVLSSMLVFCLDILVAIAHVFQTLIPTQPKPLFLITELMVMLLFIGVGLFTVKRYRDSQTRPRFDYRCLRVDLPEGQPIDRVRLVLGFDATSVPRAGTGRGYAMAWGPVHYVLEASNDGRSFSPVATDPLRADGSALPLRRRLVTLPGSRMVRSLRLVMTGATGATGVPVAGAVPVVREIAAYRADDKRPVLAPCLVKAGGRLCAN